jgi:Ca2+-transporting ATPase
MRAGPRRPEARLFDAAILTRGLWQGGGLLLMLLGLYALVRHETGSDDTARALTFAVLVASNLGLIHVNRAWEVMSWRTRRARGPSNRSLAWIAALTLLMLFLVLGIPALRQIFAFRLPYTGWLIAAAGAVLLMVAWFEGVKWALVRRHVSRTAASKSHR